MTDWLANILQIIGLFLLSEKYAAGWLFGIAAECLWLRVAKENRLHSLMFMSLVYIGIAGWSFYNWRRISPL